MSAINNGGPAFPVATQGDCENGSNQFGHQFSHSIWQFPGMTLRDYFAAKAMTQTMREFDDDWKTHAYEQDTFLQWSAERAYKIADAMLRARGEA